MNLTEPKNFLRVFGLGLESFEPLREEQKMRRTKKGRRKKKKKKNNVLIMLCMGTALKQFSIKASQQFLLFLLV